MEIVKVPIVNKSNNELPSYADGGFNSGCDVRANLLEIKEKFLFQSDIIRREDKTIECIRIYPGGRALIPTGLHVAIPEGYEIQVRPRSGLALKHGVSCTNTPGTIDSCYRDDIGVILENRGIEPFDIYQGDRIAQLVLQKVPIIEWVPVKELDKTERHGGFGHTGTK